MNALIEPLRNLGPMRLAVMGGVAALLLLFFIFLIARMSATDMALLYGDLDLTDSGRIAAELDGMQVPFEVRADGGSIMVPADQVDRLRVAMAEAGLPNGGSIGYEIFDRADGFGATNFIQNINRLRALEGELARTIGTIANVRQARVHLVMPERELFSREQQAPSASVFLRLTGPGLAPEQIVAIQHLVSAAVPRLQARNISIVDDRGNLLASTTDGDSEQQAALTGEQARRALERRLAETVEALLSRTVGFGRVRAQVNADMDFNRVTTSSETFDPNSQVARSTQLVQDQSSNTAGEGEAPVTVGTNLPEASALGAPGGPGGPTSQARRTEETTNYEISRTTQSTVRQGGEVRRLSIAVLIDGTYQQNADGQVEYQPRSQDEMDRLAALVRSAVGFNAERGDTIEVANLRFITPEEEALQGSVPAETILGMEADSVYRIAEMLVLGIVAVLVILLVVRPVLGRVFEGGAAGQNGGPMDDLDSLLTDQSGLQRALAGPGMGLAGHAPELSGPESSTAAELDALIDINQVEGRVRASSLRKVGEIVEKHPEEAVSIIRNWMYQDM